MNQPIIRLKDILNDVIQGLEYLRQGKETKRAKFVARLQQPKEQLSDCLRSIKSNVYKSYPNILELRDSVQVSVTTCLSLSELVASGKIKVRPALEKIAEVQTNLQADQTLCAEILEYVKADATEEQDEANMKAVRRDQREDAATAKTAKVLSRFKATYAHKVPKQFTDTIKFIELPVMARFSTLSMNADSLTRMGFKIETAGLHSTPSSDLGIIFERQTLLFFRMSDAREAAEEQIKRHKRTDSVQVRRTAIMKSRSAEKRAIRKLEREAEGLPRRRRLLIDKQIGDHQARIDDLTRELDSMIESVKQSNSVTRVVRQMRGSNDHALLNYLNTILDAINAKSSTDYALFTTMPLQGIMRDSDVCAAWLMPKGAIKRLLHHTGGDTKLQKWMLPW
ncbi:hypothetical protein YOLOSWAG_329 [Erwinia phage vB_EamM_Yoloswag]|uniref:Uncharacterized protein n=1 Tax=Erwinia phage vB_EamM_Yoloswag TaxID=1958956 RepID=A0A1S6L3P6_9CAUD|nr:hypothetical protein HOR66_gp329 [Erwinia phage vB_EamM_Yoloswag]AQT28797.1 hypothetical protein YOLOSWAG_329 [Erwinia phage vB_EamM_Yoloswag]